MTCSDKNRKIIENNLAPQNRKQNVKIQSRTLWKSFQLECTIYTIILCPDLYDDVTKNVLTSPKNIFCNFVPYITYHIRGKFYYHSSSQLNFRPPPPPPPVVRSPKKPSLNRVKEYLEYINLTETPTISTISHTAENVFTILTQQRSS